MELLNEKKNKKALIIIDMQYDICDGGIMANINSLRIISKINSIRDDFDLIIFINKVYPNNHASFSTLKPPYCIINTFGSKLHNDLIMTPNDIIINICTLQKYESNSGFYDAEPIEKQTNLKYILEINNISNLYFCGNDMDTCIFGTIMDAINFKFTCFVINDAIGYRSKEKYDDCILFLKKLGVTFINI